MCFLKIRFFWEPGAFDDKGEFVNDRLKCINKVRIAERKEESQRVEAVSGGACRQDRPEVDRRSFFFLASVLLQTGKACPGRGSFVFLPLVSSSCNRYGSSRQA